MKSFLKVVVIFLFFMTNICIVSATPTWTVTEDGTLMIHCEAQGDILSLYRYKVGPYKKVIVSGGPLSVLDVCTLQSETNKCVSIDLTDAQVPFNKIMAQDFMDLEYLEEFKCPKTITSIESQSFNNCPNLRRVVFPRTLKKIEYETFQDCPKLEVEIPSNVEIGEDAFTESKVTIIDPVTESESPAHRFCSWFLDFFRGKDKVR